jgi:hypothetical protein
VRVRHQFIGYDAGAGKGLSRLYSLGYPPEFPGT